MATAQELIKLAVTYEKYDVVENLAKALNEPIEKAAKSPVIKKKRGRKAKIQHLPIAMDEDAPVVLVESDVIDKIEETKAKKREYMRQHRAKKAKKNAE